MKQGWSTDVNGVKFHYVDNQLHNDSGPAIISGSAAGWFKNGKHHREDGPAVEDIESGHREWWHEGECIGLSWTGFTQEKFEQWLKFRAFS